MINDFTDKVNFLIRFNKNSSLFLRKAFSEIEKDNVEEGIFILQEGLKTYPDYLPAILLLVTAYLKNKEPRQALQTLKEAVHLIPSARTYEHYLTMINVNLEASKEESLLRKSESDEQNDDAKMTETLANIYIAQGEYLEAVKTYEKLIMKYPARKDYFLEKLKTIKDKI